MYVIDIHIVCASVAGSGYETQEDTKEEYSRTNLATTIFLTPQHALCSLTYHAIVFPTGITCYVGMPPH